MSNMFSAGSSAIGYLYQIRYSLYVILKKIDMEISIEQLDDVAFEQSGTATELIQLKHHINQRANLTDGSSDFWKSIRIWCEAIKNNQVSVPGVIFSLVTTATAPANSIASLLRADNNRDPRKAHLKMLEYIDGSDSKENKTAYQAFLKLTDDQQFRLVEGIYILDQTENIEDIVHLIKKELKLVVSPKYINHLYERLEGWWFERVITHLMEGSQVTISGKEVHQKIQNIRDQLRPDALPIDFSNEEPPETELTDDKRLFVQQLKVIALSEKRIKNAIRDFYRASKQRSKWISDDLVSINELEKYEQQLFEEWEEYFEIVNEGEIDYTDERALQANGKKLYNELMRVPYLNIRRDCTESYVMRGSYHILADQFPVRLGWHPQFKDKFSNYQKGEEGAS